MNAPKPIGGDNGGTWGPTAPGLWPWERSTIFDHLPDAYHPNMDAFGQYLLRFHD
jgi:hypothetical protein